MDSGFIAAGSALLGALIGSVSSIATMLIQAKYKDKRDRVKQIVDVAIAEQADHLRRAERSKTEIPILPVSAYIYNNALILDALEDRQLNAKRFREIDRLNNIFIDTVFEVDEARRSKKSER